MKQLVIIVLAAAVIATGISSIKSYSTSSDIANQRGWPISYYQLSDAPIPNLVEGLCDGTDSSVTGAESCEAAAPAMISKARVAMNFVVWLAISSVAGGTFYFFRQKPKQLRA